MSDESDAFLDLRTWISTHCSLGDQVRDEAYRCGLSALVHRWIKWGFDAALNTLTARDLLTCCLMCGGEFAEMFLRTAFTRAIVDNDGLVLQRLMDSPFIPQSRLWLAKLIRCFRGTPEELLEGARWMEAMQGEELALATILLCRAEPAIAGLDSLAIADQVAAPIAAALCLELIQRPEWAKAIQDWVRARPAVRYSVDDERWGF